MWSGSSDLFLKQFPVPPAVISLDSVFDEVAFDDETIYHRLVQRELK